MIVYHCQHCNAIEILRDLLVQMKMGRVEKHGPTLETDSDQCNLSNDWYLQDASRHKFFVCLNFVCAVTVAAVAVDGQLLQHACVREDEVRRNR